MAAATLGLVAACGGSGDDATGEIVERDADAAADAMDQRAEALDDAGSEGAAGVVEAQANAMREAGEGVEEAIDDADVETENPAATAAAIEAHSGMPTTDATLKDAAKAKE